MGHTFDPGPRLSTISSPRLADGAYLAEENVHLEQFWDMM